MSRWVLPQLWAWVSHNLTPARHNWRSWTVSMYLQSLPLPGTLFILGTCVGDVLYTEFLNYSIQLKVLSDLYVKYLLMTIMKQGALYNYNLSMSYRSLDRRQPTCLNEQANPRASRTHWLYYSLGNVFREYINIRADIQTDRERDKQTHIRPSGRDASSKSNS